MPYFYWQGVDLQGRDCKGMACAQSLSELDEHLFKRDIALIKHTQTSLPFWKSIGSSKSALPLVQQLAFLLSAGVLLPKALRIVTQQAPLVLQEVMSGITYDVEQGVPLYQAMQKHSLFDVFVVTMARVGVESGALPVALHLAADYLEQRQEVAKKLRASAMVPILTALIFVVVVLVIFTVMVPRFADLYKSAQQQLPTITRMVVSASNFVCTLSMLWVLSGIVLCIVSLAAYFRTADGKIIFDKIMLQLPLVSEINRWRAESHFFGATALLTKGGMSLVPALTMAQQTVANSHMRKALSLVVADVESGCSLSQALGQQNNVLVGQDVIALIRVGEESGQLPVMLTKVASAYQSSINERLSMLTTLFQPILVIVLGIFIVLVIVAAYLPIFNLSNIF
jgi:type II secretory pathway component PulF